MNVRHDMVTVFVIRPDEAGGSHEVLQLLRAKDDYIGGTWQIIRGTLEAEETYVAGALRELREESGLRPKEFYRLDAVESFYTAVDDTLWHAVAFCAVVGREQEVVLNAEHEGFRWIAREEIEGRTMWFSELELLKALGRTVLEGGAAKAYLRVEI